MKTNSIQFITIITIYNIVLGTFYCIKFMNQCQSQHSVFLNLLKVQNGQTLETAESRLFSFSGFLHYPFLSPSAPGSSSEFKSIIYADDKAIWPGPLHNKHQKKLRLDFQCACTSIWCNKHLAGPMFHPASEEKLSL